eukprot:12410694-Karenia_brevis.AAC.1
MAKEGLKWTTIQKIAKRSSSTLGTVLGAKKPTSKNPKGAPKKLPQGGKEMKRVLKRVGTLQKHAKARKEVKLAMIKDAAGVDVCDKTLREAFKKEGISFAKLKEGPILDVADVKNRFAWVASRKGRLADSWVTEPHAVIDNKLFQMFVTEQGRDYAARRKVRGAYQAEGQDPKPWLVKPKSKSNIKFPAKGITVTAAAINGKIRMWDYVQGHWNGQAAADMYKGPLAKALRKAYPAEAAKATPKWLVLEDKDPSGYKSSKGMAAKDAVGISADELPRRSPDLNVLDYA